MPRSFGMSGDIPVPGDYDGNGVLDRAVFRPTDGRWYVDGQSTAFFGTSGDVPVPGEWDVDAATDIAVYRPSAGRWFVLGGADTAWGTGGDLQVILPQAIARGGT